MTEKYLVSDDLEASYQRLCDILLMGLRFASNNNGVFQGSRKPADKIFDFNEAIPLNGVDADTLYDQVVEKVIKGSVNQNSNFYCAFPDGNDCLAGLSGAILEPLLNQNLISENLGAPTGVFLEYQVISWLRELVGFDVAINPDSVVNQIGGLWASGGVMANQMAILTALERKYPGVRKNGVRSLPHQPKILVCEDISHFSIKQAAENLGLGGESALISLPSTHEYTTCATSLDALEFECQADIDDAFILIAVAGNCRTTSIDHLSTFATYCEKHGLWYHVDACQGGSYIFSDQLKAAYLGGIEMADSVSIDPHKGLSIPYPISYVLYKNPSDPTLFSRYPLAGPLSETNDLGLIHPFLGSRGMGSLRLWMQIKALGKSGISARIEKRMDSVKLLHDKLSNSMYFLCFNQPDLYRIAFSISPELLSDKLSKPVTSEDISRINQLIADTLYSSGVLALDSFSLKKAPLRMGLDHGESLGVLAIVLGGLNYNAEEINGFVEVITDAACGCIEKYAVNIREIKKEFSGPAGW